MIPMRLLRLVLHVLFPFLFLNKSIQQYKFIKSTIDWIVCLPFYIMDLFLIPEFYELLMELVFFNNRSLTDYENSLLKDVFGDKLHHSFIRLNAGNWIAKKMKIAYVSFNHINVGHKLSHPILIHELVHIWQYQNFGSVYIYKALRAQYSAEGYNYGDVSQLWKIWKEGGDLLHFNFEQQADIIQHYFEFSQTTEIPTEHMSVYNPYRKNLEDLV